MEDKNQQNSKEVLEEFKGFYNDLKDSGDSQLLEMVQDLPFTSIEKITSAFAEIQAVRGYVDRKKLKIRTYRSGELGYIAWRHSVIYRQEYDLGDIFEFYLIQGMYQYLNECEGRGEVWVIDYAGKVQGSIAIVETEPGVAQLRWFLIEPEFRGFGLGKKLMETCMKYCREKNYNNVYLWTFDELDAARHLYESFGFRVTETKTSAPWGRDITEERWDIEL